MSETLALQSAAAKQLADAISTPLRAVYSELLNKPIPDKFVTLLESLAARDKSSMEPKA